ncbi:hypothetical protein U0070_017404 [Myodes glareolus]|uniref:G-protein coupled receptors family 1 profile domain-containing protein n=1 Tax=Myodes glareolus TaxID=447135 RepID=A0AAW0H962_MYOGA
MGRDNQTSVAEFILLGLSGKSEQEEIVFGLFLGMYMVTISGNYLIILAVSCDPYLHTPMYFFLASLSSVDICFSSVTIPKALVNHVVGSKSISYMECMIQIYFFITFIYMDGFLLSVMAYDRYVAICHPLHYILMMSPRRCVLLLAISWVITYLHALLHIILMVCQSMLVFPIVLEQKNHSRTTRDMNGNNQTTVTEFLLLGLSEESEQQEVVFGMFLGMYIVTICGNLLIILAVSCDPHLHTPMYFFLANLSSVDICFSSVTVPKALANHMVGSKSITYIECMTQIYFLFAFGTLDNFLLSVMAYDRYVAICHPLHYTLMMRPRLCVLLVAISWVIANLHVLLHTLLMVRLTFCSHNAVPHFFCDPYLVMKLSCSDTFINDVTVFAEAGLVYAIPFVCIVVSYAYICSKVLKMPSAQGRRKAMSTCGSHLTVVCLFYGAILGIYMHPSSSYSLQDAVASVIFTVVTPMTNPFIYSLRNHDIKGALRKIILRLSGKSEQEKIFFGMFLGMYLVTISGSLLIILAISCDPHLHTPIYFLANLSSVDICFSSVTVPKTLVNHMVESKSISYMQFMAQIYFFLAFGTTDNDGS